MEEESDLNFEESDLNFEDSTFERFRHSKSPEYGEKLYWEERYNASEFEIYDWYQDYDSCLELKLFLNKWIEKKQEGIDCWLW